MTRACQLIFRPYPSTATVCHADCAAVVQTHMWTEEELVWTLAVVMIANALVTFVVLILGVQAPYGRYFSEMNLGILINGNLAWFIQVRQLWSGM